MKFTGLNLRRVHAGLTLLAEEAHNTIVTCPDPVEHAEDLAAITQEKEVLEKLLVQVHRSIQREGKKVQHWTVKE